MVSWTCRKCGTPAETGRSSCDACGSTDIAYHCDVHGRFLPDAICPECEPASGPTSSSAVPLPPACPPAPAPAPVPESDVEPVVRLWLERPVVVEVRSAAIAALSEAWYTLRRRVRGFKVVVLLAVAGLILGPWKIGIAMAAIVAAIAALGVVRSAMSGSAHSIGRAVEFLGRGLGFGAVAFGVALAAASLPPAFTDALSLSSLIHQIEGRLSAGSASIPSSSTIPVWRPLHASANPDPPIGLIERVKQRLRGPLGNSAVQEKSRLPRRGNVTTVTKVVNLRAGPSMDSEILSKIRPPNALKVLSGPKNGWLMVQVQQRTGWMYKQAHLLVERPDPVTCRVRQDRGSVQVVRAPSASGAVLATLVPGGEYEFSRLHDDDAWVEIVGDAGATGWVLRSAVQLWGEDSRSR